MSVGCALMLKRKSCKTLASYLLNYIRYMHLYAYTKLKKNVLYVSNNKDKIILFILYTHLKSFK